MIIYSIILFVASVLFLVIGVAIRKGNTKLIHDYHQTNIKESDRLKYGKAFANGLFSICAALFISGVIALSGESSSLVAAASIVLFVGLIISVIILIKVQKKYNGGVF